MPVTSRQTRPTRTLDTHAPHARSSPAHALPRAERLYEERWEADQDPLLWGTNLPATAVILPFILLSGGTEGVKREEV